MTFGIRTGAVRFGTQFLTNAGLPRNRRQGEETTHADEQTCDQHPWRNARTRGRQRHGCGFRTAEPERCGHGERLCWRGRCGRRCFDRLFQSGKGCCCCPRGTTLPVPSLSSTEAWSFPIVERLAWCPSLWVATVAMAAVSRSCRLLTGRMQSVPIWPLVWALGRPSATRPSSTGISSGASPGILPRSNRSTSIRRSPTA
jgi:hypothetical protein